MSNPSDSDDYDESYDSEEDERDYYHVPGHVFAGLDDAEIYAVELDDYANDEFREYARRYRVGQVCKALRAFCKDPNARYTCEQVIGIAPMIFRDAQDYINAIARWDGTPVEYTTKSERSWSTGLPASSDDTAFHAFIRWLGRAIRDRNHRLIYSLLAILRDYAPAKIRLYTMHRAEDFFYPERDCYERPISKDFQKFLAFVPRALASQYLVREHNKGRVPRATRLWYCDQEDYEESLTDSSRRMMRWSLDITNPEPFRKRPWLDPGELNRVLTRGLVQQGLETSRIAPVAGVVMGYLDSAPIAH